VWCSCTLLQPWRVPPIAFKSLPFWMVTPSWELPKLPVPSAVVPMKLPSILFSVATSLETTTPDSPFPEMTLRASGDLPPIVLEPPVMCTPLNRLPRSPVPAAVVPM